MRVPWNVAVIGQRNDTGVTTDHSYKLGNVDVRNSPEKQRELLKTVTYRGGWQDPYSDRAMTWGELGCTVSHVDALRFAAARDRPTLVLEDDARPAASEFMSDSSFFDDMDDALDKTRASLVYLSQYKHGKGLPLGRSLYRVTDHPMWTLAYVVNQKGAQNLLHTMGENPPLSPADDFLPALMGLHRSPGENAMWQDRRAPVECYSTMQRLFVSPKGSPESLTERGPYLPSDANIVLLTYATDEEHPGYQRMKRSAERYGYPEPINLHRSRLGGWDGGDMTRGRGGAQKVKAVFKHYFAEQPTFERERDHDQFHRQYVLFVDGYDTIFQAHANGLVSHYQDMAEGKILVSGESTCWPDKKLEIPLAAKSVSGSPCPFPNSGIFMGRNYVMREMFADAIDLKDDDDDQLYLQTKLLDNESKFVVDAESRVFCSLNQQSQRLTLDYGRGQLVVDDNKWPFVVHGNGPSDERLEGDLAAIGGRIRTHYGNIEES